jgi:tetratricopeptide (TPR) repeat protein
MFPTLAWSVLCGGSLLAQGLIPPPPERLLQEAIALHQKGDFQGAIADYRAYLKLRPRALDARSNLGAALAHLGLYKEAIAEYQQALKVDPKNPGVLLNLGLAYYKSGSFVPAIERLSLVHDSQPGNRQITLLLADTYLQLGDNRNVIRLLEPLEAADPNDLAVAYMLGTALIRDNQPARGQVLVDRILRNGDSAEARMLLGITKLQARDFAGARDDLARAVHLNPNLPDVYSAYGSALMATGDPANAADAFRKELESNPNDFTANLDLGVLAKQDQQYDRALAHFERALNLRPGDLAVRYQIATVHLATGHVEAARGELESILKEAPQFTEAHVSMATVYYRLKRRADGDRERAIVQKLNAQAQASEPGARAQGGSAGPGPN